MFSVRSLVAAASSLALSAALANAASPQTASAAAGPRHAEAAEWSRAGDTVRLTVLTPWKGARKPLKHLLIAGPVSGKGREGEIRLPARRIACLAAVHVGFLAALGETGRIVAVDAGRHVYDSAARAAIAAGRIVEVGSDASLNVERLLAAKPDLVLANAVGASGNAALDRLRRAGIPVIVTAEWMENHPLARAEWIRVIGALVGAEIRADSLFAVVESGYRRRAAEARGRESKPTVLLGSPFRDQWFVAGGRSFMARLLEDAGANYLWAEDTTAGGVPLGFEAVLARARRRRVAAPGLAHARRGPEARRALLRLLGLQARRRVRARRAAPRRRRGRLLGVRRRAPRPRAGGPRLDLSRERGHAGVLSEADTLRVTNYELRITNEAHAAINGSCALKHRASARRIFSSFRVQFVIRNS